MPKIFDEHEIEAVWEAISVKGWKRREVSEVFGKPPDVVDALFEAANRRLLKRKKLIRLVERSSKRSSNQ